MCDKHVIKMITETAQLLATAVYLRSSDTDHKRLLELASAKVVCKPTHHHHPCVKWAIESVDNMAWLLAHGLALSQEYYDRYGHLKQRRHRSEAYIRNTESEFPTHFDGKPELHTDFVQALPEDLRSNDAVTSYRHYYMRDKRQIARWKNGPTPEWWLV